jgi:hypothetical protein
MGFRDKRKAGRSAIVPFIPGEDTGDRHARRLGANLLNEQAAREQAIALGLTLDILNDGQHWRFSGTDNFARVFLAEWWPSSAKLVINKQWRRGIHCHDWQQVIAEIKLRKEV